MFYGVFNKIQAGKFRDYNITKKGWVLNGDTVLYGDADLISRTLEYDFNTEKNFDYSELSKKEIVKHLTRFIANIWQVHPFGEGNTRTTAVFTIKYFRSLGFKINNEPFEKYSWYFRNALVRANYTNIQKNIYMNTEFLEKFFRNLLLDEHNELKNRYMHIQYEAYSKNLEEKQNLPVNLPVNKKMTELLNLLKENPFYTYDELAKIMNCTRETVRVNLRKLETGDLICRIGSDKNGHWEIK